MRSSENEIYNDSKVVYTLQSSEPAASQLVAELLKNKWEKSRGNFFPQKQKKLHTHTHTEKSQWKSFEKL